MVAAKKNYHTILEIKPGATAEEIKSAFKEKAFQYHPDRNPHDMHAAEQFHDVMEAYAFLSGSQETYEALRHAPPQGSAVTTAWEEVEDIFQELFDLDLSPATVCETPLKVDLSLSLEEAFCGGEHELKLERNNLCSTCLGRGVEKGAKTFTCTYCFGEGEVERSAQAPLRCPKCNGRGFLSSQGCIPCRARGVIRNKFKLKVLVPSKSAPGKILRVENQGHEVNPGIRSEVEVKLQIKKHPRFSFDAKDVMCEVPIHLSDAALGNKISVPTLAGTQWVKIPVGTQSGEVIRLKGMGLGGDQLLRIWVQTPKALTERDRSFFQTLKGSKNLWVRLKRWIW